MHFLSRTLRYLAIRFLADRSAPTDQSNENTARTNAAEASATLRK